MRHSSHRHFNPAKQDNYETNRTGFYLQAFLLFCWFLACTYWVWVWYTKRRDARRKKCEEQYSIPLYEIQLWDCSREDGGELVSLSLWTDDMSTSEVAGKYLRAYGWADR